jgi:hypothetical protein
VDSVVIPETLTADNLILRNGARAVGRQITVDTLRVEAGASLTHAPQSVFGLEIEARRLVVESGAAIDVTGRGHLGGDRVPGVADTAHTLNFQLGAEAGAGGSHGGLGGDYSSNGARGPSPIYGDVRRPAELGGGGGAWSGVGGDGGGIVRIFASESVVVDGAVRANGGVSSGSASGEGAGGSVWIETGTFGGDGTVSADGGTQNNGNHTGGGGGRVAIYTGAVNATSDLLGARRATAYGGDGFYGDGAPGTVFVTLGGVETLIFDAGRTSDRWTPESSLPPLGPGVAANVTADSFDVDGALPTPGVRDFHLTGLRVNPDTTQDESFFVETNFASSVGVRTPNENGVHFADVASDGASYAGVWRFENVVLRGGASVAFFDPITVDDTLAVTERSLLTHPDATDVYAPALDVEAGTLAIDATSSIDVSARGHLGGGRFGLGSQAHTVGFAPGAGGGAGGSHGGLGGDYPSNGASVPNPVYGDADEPVELGSGGGAWGGDGGDGGGRVRVVVGALELEGAIRANGGVSSGSASGDGSGGSVNVRAGSIAGSGVISADGGTSNGTAHTSGGGGRVAIRYASPAGPLPVSATAAAGDGFYGDGEPGSVFVEGP